MAFGAANEDEDDEPVEQEEAVELSELAGEEGGEKGRRLAAYWKGQLEAYDTENENWVKRGDTIEKRYRDDRNRINEEGQRRANNLWANVQVILPSIFGRCPLPIAERRFRDKDPIGKSAAQIIERALRNEMEVSDFEDSVGSAVLDYLLPGRGVVWLRYEPEFEKGLSIPVQTQNDLRDAEGKILDEDEDRDWGDDEEDSETDKERDEDQTKLNETGDRLKRETVQVDYIHWRDFRCMPANVRRWSEVRAISKDCYMSRDQMRNRFGKDIGDAIPLLKDNREKRGQNESRMQEEHRDAKGCVTEIWDLDSLRVYWVAEGYEFLCDMKDDFLELEKFFPVPPPLFANPTNTTIVPVPDYSQYQDQAIQIDELTHRIAMLSRSCKVAGTYNAACDELARLLDESVENELIPVDAWAAFAEKGGLEGQIAFLPLKDIVETIKTLYEVKEKIQTELDRLTGITDILRGVQSDGRVTLGGQKLQGSNGRTRLQWRQNYVGKFCRNVVRLQAEIMCKHFSAASLIEASGALYEEGLGVPDVMSMGFSGGSDALNAPPPPLQGPQGIIPRPGALQLPPPTPTAPPPQNASASISVAGGRPPAPMGGNPPLPMPGQSPPPVPQPGMGSPSSCFGSFCDEKKLFEALRRITAAILLLRNDLKRGFRVDIDVDSNVLGDQDEEKAHRVEFVEMVTKYLAQAQQMAQMNPAVLPLLGKLLQFGVRGFRVGRELESAIEDFIDEAETLAKQKAQHPPPPNPQMLQAQADMKDAETKSIEAQIKAVEAKGKLQAMGDEGQAEQRAAQAEIRRQQLESQSEMFNAQAGMKEKDLELQMKQIDLQIKERELQMKERENQRQDNEDHVMVGDKRTHVNDAINAQAAANAEHLSRMHQMHGELLKHLTAPRRVVRDRNGRVAGVVMDGGTTQQ